MFKNTIINILINVLVFLFYTIITAIWIYIHSFSILFKHQTGLLCLMILLRYIFTYIFKFYNNTRGYVLFYYIIPNIFLDTLLLATIIQLLLHFNSHLTEEFFLEFGDYYIVLAISSSLISSYIVFIIFLFNFNSKITNSLLSYMLLTMFFWVDLIILFKILTI